MLSVSQASVGCLSLKRAAIFGWASTCKDYSVRPVMKLQTRYNLLQYGMYEDVFICVYIM